LLSTDPAAAKDVVLAEKPLISEETDLIEPTLLDELICHIASLASVYHKPPNSFIEGEKGAQVMRKTLHTLDSKEESSDVGETPQAEEPVAQVIPTQDAIVNDLLGLDLGPSLVQPTGQDLMQSNQPSLLEIGNIDDLLAKPAPQVQQQAPMDNLLGLYGLKNYNQTYYKNEL